MIDVRSKEIVLSVIGIMVLVIITVGITYAMFTYSKEGTIENIVKTGTVTFQYIESDKTSGISITNAIPELDENAKVSKEDGKIFDFKVIASATGTESINYEVDVSILDGSTLDPSIFKFYLTEIASDNTEIPVTLEKYNNLKDTKITSKVGKVLYTGIIPSKTDTFTKNYRLRMWISSDTNLVNNDYSNKTFGIKVNVYANASN